MGKEIITFDDVEYLILNIKFCLHKSPIFKKDVDIEKVLICNKISSGKKSYKYFIGYLYSNYKVKPLHIMLPKTSVYVQSYDGKTKWMYFFIEDDDLLEKCKVRVDVKRN